MAGRTLAAVRWKRGTRLPDQVRESLDLAHGEQVLAAAPDATGGWVVATDAALFVGSRRVGWESIARAAWDDDSSVLTVEAMRSADERPQVLRPVLPEPGFVPETVRERVESSIVATRRVRVRAGVGLRVVARAVPRSDELLWQVVLDPGLDVEDPQVQAASDGATAELRRELGV